MTCLLENELILKVRTIAVKRRKAKLTNAIEETFWHDVEIHENQVEWNSSQDEDKTEERL